MKLDRHFKCPKCKGRKFGSYQLADGSLERMCQEEVYRPGEEHELQIKTCGFTWNQKEDWKYEVIEISKTEESDSFQPYTNLWLSNLWLSRQ